MIKAVNIVNVFNSLSIDRIFRIDSKTVIAYKASLTVMRTTHISLMSKQLFTYRDMVYWVIPRLLESCIRIKFFK